MKPQYRIVRYKTYYRGQIWRWWFPFWTFMGDTENWYRTAEEAEKKVIEKVNYKETEVVKNLGNAKGDKE